ncbi:MAG: PH domain-containing protein, partial [Nonlabens sp.]|nr:PH domain-containing protein [Nonlabens sp.]
MLDLSQPTRQSKKSILFYLFKNIKGVLVIGLYAIFGWNSSRELLWSAGIIIVFTVIALIAPVFRYYFFKFHIAAGELIITDGLLFKTRKAVPLERIQSININQNLLQRVLGISSLELETAGSSAKELEIPALNSAFAKAFKDTLKIKTQAAVAQPAILQDGDAIVSGSTEENEQSTEPQLQEAVEEQESRTIIKLGIVDLLKIGLTQNHLASGGVALGVVIGLWFQIKDIVERFIGDPFENLDEDLKETVVSGSFHIA